MGDLLTARDMQNLLQVDRSTIYRMAEAQKLPAIKVGRQWRFPADQIKRWLQQQTMPSGHVSRPIKHVTSIDLTVQPPASWVQLTQDLLAESLGVMAVITDMQGNPLTEVSHPCGLFKVTPLAIQKCIENWTHLEATPGLTPQFIYSRLGLLGTRGLIRIGSELKGMVIMGGIAPDDWPPPPDQVVTTASVFGLPPETLTPHLHEVFYLDQPQREQVLVMVQCMADRIAQIANKQGALLEKFKTTAQLANNKNLHNGQNLASHPAPLEKFNG